MADGNTWTNQRTADGSIWTNQRTYGPINQGTNGLINAQQTGAAYGPINGR